MTVVMLGPDRSAPTPSIPETATTPASEPASTEAAPAPVDVPVADVGDLTLRNFDDDQPPQPLGGLDDPASSAMLVELTRSGAGIASIRFSNIFETVQGRLAWNRWRSGNRSVPEPSIDDLYLLSTARDVPWASETGAGVSLTSVLGAHTVLVNDQPLALGSASVWRVTGPGGFEAIVEDASGSAVARITRTWSLRGGHGLHLDQRIENLASGVLQVQWLQWGPPSLLVDRSRYMDTRRFRFGWELGPSRDPNAAAPVQASTDVIYEYRSIADEPQQLLWPTQYTADEDYHLSWFASTNRYFALAVFPALGDQGQGSRLLGSRVDEIHCQVIGEGEHAFILTGLHGAPATVQPGDAIDLSLGIYAGPLQRGILGTQQPYVSLNMRMLVLYQMSMMCAFCTFQWLADILAWLLTTLDHRVVFDWGLAIVLLVLIVRTLLHPITKKSQVNMQRFTRSMAKLKPELDKLKERCADDPKRMQREQMELMRQHGANPLHMLGCLPMFLQMPVWVALYAVLYFNFDLRQEPAFFGMFQLFGDWQFLADLGAADHFFGQFDEPISFFFWNITGINLLPFLMGGIFYIQQKYMSPQNLATMTADQQTQQKMMRVMTVVLFPLMLYSAPSGLTLYILTSSTVGILESRHIRAHIDKIDADPSSPPTPGKKRKPKDRQARAWQDAMEARRKKVQNKAANRSYKKRQ